MTRYDPFSHGQVKFGDAKEAVAEPDDMLFSAPSPMNSTADSGWAQLGQETDGPLPHGSSAAFNQGANEQATMEFGADILGEVDGDPARLPPAAPPRAKPAPARPADRPDAAAAAGRPPAAQNAGSLRSPIKNAVPPVPIGRATAPVRPPAVSGKPAAYLVRGRGAFAVLVPLSICAAGGAAGAWFLVMQQNPVMAGIVAATACVGAALAWLMGRS